MNQFRDPLSEMSNYQEVLQFSSISKDQQKINILLQVDYMITNIAQGMFGGISWINTELSLHLRLSVNKFISEYSSIELANNNLDITCYILDQIKSDLRTKFWLSGNICLSEIKMIFQ